MSVEEIIQLAESTPKLNSEELKTKLQELVKNGLNTIECICFIKYNQKVILNKATELFVSFESEINF